MSNEWYSEQPYDESSTSDEPAVGGWGEIYGEAAPQEQEQSVWDEVTEWVEDITDTTPEAEPAHSASNPISDIADKLLNPIRRDQEVQQMEQANQLAAFRGALSSAIHAAEPLGPDSSSDQVRYAAALTAAAGNAAYATADAFGHNSSTGSRCVYHQGTLAWAASELESVANSVSADMRQSAVPGIVSTLYGVAGDVDSLY